ncbi:MAG TPA: sensor histidine kinase, partial [Rhodospirillaceae bacterium]|nr:sensor histidine kinase [Rhodospirillaceae bacterium]
MSAIAQLFDPEIWAGLCLLLVILAGGLAVRLFLVERRTEQDAAALWRFLDAVPFPVWRRDGDARLLGANRSYLELVNATRGELPQRQPEIGARQDQDDRPAMAHRAMKTGLTLSESQYVVVDGARRLFEITEVPLEAIDGGSLGFALDRTSLEEVQSELAQHIAAHGEVLEVLRTAVAIFSADRHLRFSNSAFADLWRLEPEDLAGDPTLDQLLDLLQDRRRLPEVVDFQAYKERQNRLFTSLLEPEERLMHLPDDRTLRLVISPHPLGGLLFLYEDVTDRLSLERSYNTLIEMQRTTLDNLRQAVAVFGGDGRLRVWNPPFARLWGFAAADLDDAPHVGELVEQILERLQPHQAARTSKEALVVQVTEPKAEVGRMELTDDTMLDYGIVPMPDGGCMATYLDVTDTARVQRALEERTQALENADRVKSEFIANISYELRTPLNAIIGFTDFLNHQIVGALNDRQREYVDYIMSSSNQLLTLINDILDLATIEAGYLELDREEIDLAVLLDGLASMMGDRAEKGGVAVELDYPPDIGTLSADATRLRQAIFNLLSNAVKFTPDGGTVTLKAARTADVVTVTVEDTGIGFDSAKRETLFEKFEIGDTRSRESGIGLGLALTRSLIDLHGGSVELESAVDKGTKAICRLTTTDTLANTAG